MGCVNPYVNLLPFSYPSNYSFSFQKALITTIPRKYSTLFTDIYIVKCLKVQWFSNIENNHNYYLKQTHNSHTTFILVVKWYKHV